MVAPPPPGFSLPEPASLPSRAGGGAAHLAPEGVAAYFRRAGTPGGGAEGLYETGAGTGGRFAGLRLSSAFQPLLYAHSLLPAAHEALLRVEDGQGRALSPADAFARAADAGEMVYLDRLCRMIHVLNFVRQRAPDDDLYLNVHGGHLLGVAGGHGSTFEMLLRHCALSPRRVVLEIIEAGIDDIGHLSEAVDAYRARGYRVAIDDFGCQHSNFDRLWRLSPDIVKLDRSLVVQATLNPRARRMLPRLVELIHELDASVVCEGIETPEQHALAIDAGADLLQGFLYARPAADLFQSRSGLALVGG
ncbi:EAL domain-containing protein [Pseudothauera nasutitermitis]|uniref:EAL domain-containing protein n=1 Tax=Pseudothauera nasutitermitis TaxID=2565930 RepID=A0A4S4B3H7_9RHOO|nr:EAL domain-containing protein [Pseudothauera nasutitermitis]THF67220.1 EAL domain-containing protein [Pseudothauera nasutitermitis]